MSMPTALPGWLCLCMLHVALRLPWAFTKTRKHACCFAVEFSAFLSSIFNLNYRQLAHATLSCFSSHAWPRWNPYYQICLLTNSMICTVFRCQEAAEKTNTTAFSATEKPGARTSWVDLDIRTHIMYQWFLLCGVRKLSVVRVVVAAPAKFRSAMLHSLVSSLCIFCWAWVLHMCVVVRSPCEQVS